jgi:hypothetical protein
VKVTAAGIDSMKISNAEGTEKGAQFIVWLFFQVEDEGRQTGQELVVSVPYDPDLTFNKIARQAFSQAATLLRAGCDMGEKDWWQQFNRSLEPLPEWTATPH